MQLNKHKHTIFPLTLLLLTITFFSSCKKEYINGHLDGQWRIESIIIDDESQETGEALYWNFSFHVAQLSRYGGPVANGNMSFDGERLEVDFPTMRAAEGRETIRKWGVYSNPTTFMIDELSSSHLTMRDGNVVIKMHKY